VKQRKTKAEIAAAAQSQLDVYKIFEAEAKKIGTVSVRPMNTVVDPKANFTGSAALDIQLHIPFADGGMHEVYGEASSGKTTLALSVAGISQAGGKYVAYANMEGSINRSLVESIPTIDLEAEDEFGNKTFQMIEADTGEDCLDAVKAFVKIPNSICIVDSIDSLVPESVAGGPLSKQHMAKLAKLMSAACRDLKDVLRKSRSTVVFINQIRKNPGVMFGDNTALPGGMAMGFYAIQRVQLGEIYKKNYIVDADGRVVGQWVDFFIKKNKCAAPYVKGKFPIRFGYGVWSSLDALTTCVQFGIIEAKDKGRIIMPEMMAEYDPPFKCNGVTSAFQSQVVAWLDETPAAVSVLYQELKDALYGNYVEEPGRDSDEDGSDPIAVSDDE
jgi:recombination protein RecA